LTNPKKKNFPGSSGKREKSEGGAPRAAFGGDLPGLGPVGFVFRTHTHKGHGCGGGGGGAMAHRPTKICRGFCFLGTRGRNRGGEGEHRVVTKEWRRHTRRTTTRENRGKEGGRVSLGVKRRGGGGKKGKDGGNQGTNNCLPREMLDKAECAHQMSAGGRGACSGVCFRRFRGARGGYSSKFRGPPASKKTLLGNRAGTEHHHSAKNFPP